MSNTLTTALANTRKVLAKKDVSLRDVIRAIQTDAANELPVSVEAPLPKKIEVTDQQRTAISTLLDTLDELSLPTIRRTLRPYEVASVLAWTQDAKSVETVVKNMLIQLKAAFFNHADVLAEEDGRAVPGETPRDKNGWYLLDDKQSGAVKGSPFMLTREAKNGSVEMTVEGIDALIADGVLPATARKRFVKTVEAVDESALLAYMADNPKDIPRIAAKVTQASAPSVSFHVRQNK